MITTRLIEKRHLNSVVDVHNSAFKGFFLTELGSNFLRLYYESVMKSDDGILYGVFDNDNLIGFCAACTRSAGFNSGLIKQNIVRYGIVSLKILFTRPKALFRLGKNLTKTGNVKDDGEYAEILSIAVRQDVQNSGTGKLLVEGVENYLRERGISELSLTTDKFDNDKTLAFYRRNGFRLMYEFVTYPDREMLRLIKDLE